MSQESSLAPEERRHCVMRNGQKENTGDTGDIKRSCSLGVLAGQDLGRQPAAGKQDRKRVTDGERKLRPPLDKMQQRSPTQCDSCTQTDIIIPKETGRPP